MRAVAVRRPRALGLGARALGPHPRRARPRVGRDLVGRRDHRPPARRRRAAVRRPAHDRAGRDRGHGRAPSCPAPRCSAPASARTPPARCCCRAPIPGKRTPAVAAAAEGAVAARGGEALRPVPDRARDLPRVPPGRARPARPPGAAARPAHARAVAGRGRDAARLAVRLLAPVRLRRHVHVRGRHAQRRAARRGAVARPRPAARAARPGGAARADRSGRARGRRGRPPAASASGPAPRTPTACTTCSARVGDLTADEAQARCLPVVAAARILAELEKERRAVRMRIGGEERWIASEDAGLYRDALGAVPPGGLPAAFLEEVEEPLVRLARRYARTHGPFTTRELSERYGARPRPGPARAGARRRPGARRAAARWHASASGATPRCCAGCGARRWPRCARRSSPPSSARSRASCPSGRAWTALRPAAPAWTACARCSCRCRAWRWRRRCGSATCCRAAWAPIRRPGWTSCARAASSCGWAPARSAATPAGSRCCFREDARLLGPPPVQGRVAVRARARGDPRAAVAAAPRSGPTCSPTSARSSPPSCRRRCGTSPGRARSRTTRSRHSARRSCRVAKADRHAGRRFARRRRPGAPQVQGRWSLTGPLFAGAPAHGPRMRAISELLLERHGIVTREAVLAEGIPGGFAGLYSELVQSGDARHRPPRLLRGGPGRRAVRPPGRDRAPARPALRRARGRRGARRNRPRQPVRRDAPLAEARGRRVESEAGPRAGAYVVTLDSEPVLYVERGGKGLLALREPDEEWLRPGTRGAGRGGAPRPRATARHRALRRRARGGLRGGRAPDRARLPPEPAPPHAERLTAQLTRLSVNVPLPYTSS